MKKGGTLTAQSFFNHAWKPARAAAGFDHGEKHVTVHSLRHLHAAALLAAGMDMYQVSARLGHNNISVTIDIYSHLMPDAHWLGAQHAARALGEAPEIELGELDETG
jgi:site-specific recombinase XerD